MSKRGTSGRQKLRVGGRSARVVKDVLEATLDALVAHGYSGLSIEDVAQRAGVNKTTIYRRWPARADLIRDALISLRPQVEEAPNTGSLEEDLYKVLEQRAVLLATPHRKAISQALLQSGTNPEMQAVLEAVRRERPLIPLGILERAIQRGELAPDMDATLIIDALTGALHLRTYWRREPVTEDFLRSLVALVVKGAKAQ